MLVEVVKLLTEIALMALLGQGVLALLAGAGRDRNLFYQVFRVVTRPVLAGVRWITPRVVIDRHIPLVAVLLLVFLWLFATITKIELCVRIGVHLCK